METAITEAELARVIEAAFIAWRDSENGTGGWSTAIAQAIISHCQLEKSCTPVPKKIEVTERVAREAWHNFKSYYPIDPYTDKEKHGTEAMQNVLERAFSRTFPHVYE